MTDTTSRLAAALADRYRIERELGAGGMATVYLAEDLKHKRKFALKVLRPELAAIIGATRLLAEISSAATLQHPHLLPLHDSGEVDGTAYYVMPFVEGESLRDRLNREKQLPIGDAVRQCEVTEGAHAKYPRRIARTRGPVPTRLQRWLRAVVVCLGGVIVPSTQEAQSAPASLVGTWRIIRYCDRDSTGAMVEPLGPNPTGLFVYTPTGELSIQAMRTPPSGPLAGEPVRLRSLGELRPFYFGYFGTYSILTDTTVVHHVQGGTFPDYLGTDQPRQYRIRGDTLSIGAPMFPCRVLIRAR